MRRGCRPMRTVLCQEQVPTVEVTGDEMPVSVKSTIRFYMYAGETKQAEIGPYPSHCPQCERYGPLLLDSSPGGGYD